MILLADGDTHSGALLYWSEQFYTVDPGDAAVVLNVAVDFNTENQSYYGSLFMQIFEDTTLLPFHYDNCDGPSVTCGDGSIKANGRRACRCVRTDLENGRLPEYLLPQVIVERYKHI